MLPLPYFVAEITKVIKENSLKFFNWVKYSGVGQAVFIMSFALITIGLVTWLAYSI